MYKLTTFFGILLFTSQAHAGAFLLNDHGARATGRADAVTATVEDGSSLFHNPAGIARADGINIYLGASLISPTAEFETPTGETVSTDSGSLVTPNIYVHAKFFGFLAGAIGFNTPFRSKISWPKESPAFGENKRQDIISSQSLWTFFITPAVGIDFGGFGIDMLQGLTLAAGVDLVPATIELNRDVIFGDAFGSEALGGTAFGVGGRVGLQYKLQDAPWAPEFLEGVSFGLAYRSAVKLGFDGKGDFDMDESPSPYRSQLPRDGPIHTELTLPQSVLIGLAYRIFPELELEVDVNWINWKVYDQLDIDFPGELFDDNPILKKYRDTVVIRVGLEYEIRDSGLAVRAGYAYDPTPIPAKFMDFSLPDGDRHVISFGGSYTLPSDTFVDLGLLYVLPTSQHTNDADFQPVYKGTYRISALVVALSFGVKFGGDDGASLADAPPPMPSYEEAPAEEAAPAPEAPAEGAAPAPEAQAEEAAPVPEAPAEEAAPVPEAQVPEPTPKASPDVEAAPAADPVPEAPAPAEATPEATP